MGVTIKSTNKIPKLVKVLDSLDRREIKVGVFGEDNYKYGNDADLATIAHVHEYGASIRPKNSQWLTIPLVPEAKNKRAREFSDLFFYKVDEETAFLARRTGKGKSAETNNIFLLVKSIEIPERSFIRTGFDESVGDIADKIESMLNDVLDFGTNTDAFLDAIGMEFAGMIQKSTKRITSPSNSAITSNVKGSSNPLMDTGRLIGSIRHDVD